MANAIPVIVYILVMVAAYLVLYRPLMNWAAEDLAAEPYDHLMVHLILFLVTLCWPVLAVVLIVKAVSRLVDEAF